MTHLGIGDNWKIDKVRLLSVVKEYVVPSI